MLVVGQNRRNSTTTTTEIMLPTELTCQWAKASLLSPLLFIAVVVERETCCFTTTTPDSFNLMRKTDSSEQAQK
jgi:hypothetical protein